MKDLTDEEMDKVCEICWDIEKKEGKGSCCDLVDFDNDFIYLVLTWKGCSIEHSIDIDRNTMEVVKG